MKFAVATVIAACAVTVQGFSISMSSYLDNLGGNGGLNSFSSNGGSSPTPSYSPAPSSHSPAAPAPAPYQSSFADAPANTNLNYMSSLDSGNQMKSGPNFSGVSSTFSPSQSIGNSVYLDNLVGGGGGAAPSYSSAPAPAPAAAVPAPSSAPANTGSYLQALGGSSSGGAVSGSYSMMQSSFAKATNDHPAATSGYLGSL